MNKIVIGILVVFFIIVSIVVFLYKQSYVSSQSQTKTPSKTFEKSDILAGKVSPYMVFTKMDYDKALQSKKTIFLEFYANWCPICRAQAPKLVEGFDALTNDNVVGFRVNYNDDQTDDAEKQLAKDFGVTYQHTHVILKDGKVVSKSNDDLDKESFTALIQNAEK